MRFSHPALLTLLILLPAAVWLGWPKRGVEFRRDLLSLIARLTLFMCLIAALSGLEIVRPANRLSVIYLLDVSDSISVAARQNAESYIADSLSGMGPDDQAALIVFGKNALIDRPLSNNRHFGELTSVPQSNQTDIAAAIRLGIALFPPGSARRLVLLSDGAETMGDVQAAARYATGAGIDLQLYPLQPASGADVMISQVKAPARLRQGQRFDLQITIDSSLAQQAQVAIFGDGRLLYSGLQNLAPGEQSFSLPVTAADPGFSRFSVQITAPQDALPQNNSLSAFTQVEGPPRLLLVAPPAGEPLPGNQLRSDESSALLAVLTSAGLAADAVSPQALPTSLDELAEYDEVILVDVPARQFTPRQMRSLQSYVRDLGGGLLNVGGPTSYGVGGYFRTPLEETLPIEMQIKDPQRRPSTTVLFVIDRSGSMAESSGGAVKLELAKEAVLRSIELMFPNDHAGVIAFDDAASWVVPITELNNPAAVQNAVSTIHPGGGTDILAGLQAAAAQLPGDPSTVRHIILLTDGGADPSGLSELAAELFQKDGITLTTIGVGSDAAPFLPSLAEVGGGRYHFAADPSAIPTIFTEETSLASRAYLIEHPFIPRLAASSPMLDGISSMPPLYGYVATTAKNRSRAILVSDEDDPILASWQYGLGRAVAFTSDASGRWAIDWLRWDEFNRFWLQAISYVLRQPASPNLELTIQADGPSARLVADAFQPSKDGEQRGYLNGAVLTANLITPDGETSSLQLGQTAPGRYEASFNPKIEGAYQIRLTGESPQRDVLSANAGWVLPYSSEYRIATNSTEVISQLAKAAGAHLAPSDPQELYLHNLQSASSILPAWPWLLIAAAFLLPVDIGMRRLAISLSELLSFIRKISERLQATPQRTAESASPLETLLDRKKSVHRLYSNQAQVDNSSVQTSTLKPARQDASRQAGSPLVETTTPESPGESAEKPNDDPAGASTASTLLARKRQRREDQSHR